VEYTITVTDTHITYGLPGKRCFCPIAMAIMDANIIPDTLVSVEYGAARFFRSGDMMPVAIGRLPKNAQVFVDKFDTGEPVEPFEFTMMVW